MSEFLLYLEIGKDHILDLQGFDHILFVIALCAIYSSRDWKGILFLVTAFTIGHSITLALSTFSVVSVDSNLVEFLIPATILFTAISNLFKKDVLLARVNWVQYSLGLFFGLIHGLGFSNYLKELLGVDSGIVVQLFAFNLGLEFGQIIIVVLFFIITFIMTELFSLARRDWRIIISSIIVGMSFMLLLDAKYW